MSEKLCLKWNDFQENINSAFGSLRKDNDLSNVNVYIFIHEKHEIGSTITNSMVSVVLPWKTGFKYINGTYDMNMSKVLPI